MMDVHQEYLDKAGGAMSRGDFLSALQFALRAADVPRGREAVRCDAYILLALTSIELEMGEDALAFAVGASLAATWAGDSERQTRANSVVELVMARFPKLREDEAISLLH